MVQAGISSRSFSYSAALHILILLIMAFGLPHFMHRTIDPEPQAISVEILPVSPISNIKPQEKPPEKVEEKKPVEEVKTERKEVPEAHKEESKPKEEPVSVPDKTAMKKEEKKPVKKEAKKTDDLDSILKSVKDEAKAEAAKKPSKQAVQNPAQHEAKSDHYDASIPMSMSEQDAIRSQIQKCWNPPAGAKDAYNLAVTLHLQLMQDGTVSDVELDRDTGRYGSDPFFRAAADSAIRAVKLCSPIKNLPTEKYGTWRDMEFTFDPKDLY